MQAQATAPALKHYSLWLVPELGAAARLQYCIQALSIHLGSPGFTPHVTLLGQIPGDDDWILSKFDQLAEKARIVELTPGEIEYDSYYYRAITYPIQHSSALTDLYRSARQVFGLAWDSPFTPHLSLYYGTAAEHAKRQVLAGLDCSDPGRITCNTLQLVRTVGQVADWQLVRAEEL